MTGVVRNASPEPTMANEAATARERRRPIVSDKHKESSARSGGTQKLPEAITAGFAQFAAARAQHCSATNALCVSEPSQQDCGPDDQVSLPKPPYLWCFLLSLYSLRRSSLFFCENTCQKSPSRT